MVLIEKCKKHFLKKGIYIGSRQQIENFKGLTLKYALKDMIDKQATIRTDNHRSYQHLAKEMNIRGTHHKCSDQHLHAYADE